ncbi:MAG: hypothetical protein GXP40_09335 [Chloroflexi bacterium]|nr:hypothetical protein [Chloroflexota bacterium]
MTLTAAVGQAQALDGREAGLQATHHALNQLGTNVPSLGIVITSQHYDAKQVVGGVSSLLGNTPIVGFSTPAALTTKGQHINSVVVAVLSSDEIEVEAHWFSGYAQSGRETAARLMKIASAQPDASQSMLFFADGFNGDAEQLCLAISGDSIPLAGGLSSGDPHTGHSYQIAGTQTGSGSLAAALFKGNLRMGVGADHGWRPVGSQFRVTRSRGFWLRTLDGRPASETYSQLFGYPARDWGFPPLNYLVRLYPLGIDQGENLLVRSPLRVEADGSFRMNAAVRDGLDAYLMIGSPAVCQEAAQRAAQQALRALGDAKPVFALALVDIAWQMLFKAQPGAEINAIQDILGKDIPIAGGYTLGQIVPGKNEAPPRFLNQHIMVVAFGEPEDK